MIGDNWMTSIDWRCEIGRFCSLGSYITVSTENYSGSRKKNSYVKSKFFYHCQHNVTKRDQICLSWSDTLKDMEYLVGLDSRAFPMSGPLSELKRYLDMASWARRFLVSIYWWVNIQGLTCAYLVGTLLLSYNTSVVPCLREERSHAGGHVRALGTG